MEYIKFKSGDFDTYPAHSGNWDDSSLEVIVHYKKSAFEYDSYGIGYTDWDGDNHYWNIKGEKGPFKIISWAYFEREKK